MFPRSVLAVVAALAMAGGALRAQEPQMATVVRSVPLSLDECNTRVSAALKAEGYAGLLSYGSGWIAHARRTSVSIGCLPGEHGTLLILVTAGGPLIVSEATRLYQFITDTSRVAPPESAAPSGLPPSAAAAWAVTADSLAAHPATRYNFWCPPNGVLHPVYGSGRYASNSSVCTAALHAGTISLTAGGNAIIEMRPGEASYAGSSQNGVTTRDQGAWKASFVMVGRS